MFTPFASLFDSMFDPFNRFCLFYKNISHIAPTPKLLKTYQQYVSRKNFQITQGGGGIAKRFTTTKWTKCLMKMRI